MGWFCNTLEAKAQLKKCYASNCPGCYKCVWIEESSNAMAEYGTPVEYVEEKHPLEDFIIEKFGGERI